MRFVLMSYKKVARKLIVQEYLLLAARCLMVALLAMALARPLLERLVHGFKRGERPLAVMFVLDSSLSMTREMNGESLHDIAKRGVEEWLGRTRDDDLVGLVDAVRLDSVRLTSDIGDVKEALARIEPAHSPARMMEALALSTHELSGYGHADRMVIVFTDMQRSSWRASFDAGAEPPPILVVDVSEGMAARNLSVGEVEVKRKSLAREEAAELRAKVTNHGADEVKQLLIRAEFGGEVLAQGFVEIPPGESVEKTLLLTDVPEGAGAITIEADDGMPGDNRAYFHLKGGGELRALVVDGDPKDTYMKSETYFLDHALNPRLYARSKVKPRTVTTAGFVNVGLDDYQALVLANVDVAAWASSGHKPDGKDGRAAPIGRIKEFVRQGGGLLMALGDQVDADVYNAAFGDLLPRELRGAKLSYAGARAEGEIKPMRLEAPAGEDLDHPILSLFKDPSQGDLGLAGFSKYFLVQQEITPKSKVILRLTDGAPIMVESEYGQGKVVLFTSAVDRAWNDLCIHPTFLPLLQQTVQHLGGTLIQEESGGAYTGRLIDVPVGPEVAGAVMIGPEGKSRDLELIEEIGARRIRIAGTDLPGIYLVRFRRRGEDKPTRFTANQADRIITLNVDPAESDLERLDADEIKARTGARSVTLLGADAPAGPDAAEMVETKSYASLLLFLLVAVAIVERGLARK